MTLTELSQRFARLPQVKQLAEALTSPAKDNLVLQGLTGSAVAVAFGSSDSLMSASGGGHGAVLLFIMQDADEAGYLYHDLSQILGQQRVFFMPSSYRRAIKYGQRDAANEVLRTEVLARLTAVGDGAALYIVSYPEAVAELVVSKQRLADRTLHLQAGQTIVVDKLLDTLRQWGFHEVDYVYEPGQFALRGSLLDVYSYSAELPYRIDFFGDEVDTLRTFEIETQLSREKRDSVDIVPEMAEQTDKVSLLTFLPERAAVVARNFRYVAEVIERCYREGFSAQAIEERLADAPEVERAEMIKTMRAESQLIRIEQWNRDVARLRHVELTPPHATPDGSGSSAGTPGSQPSVLNFSTSPQPLFHKNFELLAKTIDDYRLRGYHIYILADSRKQQDRLREILASEELSVNNVEFTPVDTTIHEGFVSDDLKACLFTDHQIFDRFHKYSLRSEHARSGKVALTLKELQQFEPGDYIVHIDHGIGRFGGLVRMPVSGPPLGGVNGNGTLSTPKGGAGGGFQEMIKIIYQRGDAIYVSIHSLHKVSKYKGQDSGQPPRLSTLGTGQWERMKERTKQHIKDIARDLIRLYAGRQRQRGFAYSPDGYLQQALEASFLYEDTPDQLKATQDVKADMERPRPMDRLVCGDVGFGKTEVAVRAAFKAATDGKQTAVLVPTTVLAYQHWHTFQSRLRDMPVRVEYLSRARTAKQTKELLADLAEGKIDILIGTHKLIGKTVRFHDLGLLIIDEEQKFGVAVKEKLRQMKTNVDTLTMSATPIPRTLQFSLVGARDLSIIQTPPPNRYPIQTEIHTFSADIIAEAVNFELSRNGQVYFVNNRISDLPHLKELINKYVPDARVAIGHGQMSPTELEQVVLDFANHDSDVLLSTTIVENGIDIPNANTIIINGAQNFGLSDLHQMRGRVGRSNRKAFCYLLAPPLSALPADSRRRLEALENFSGLGSGIHIAMQDLDIRGAGNLLGAEQSGFISDLGYETYQKILNEAMAELKNEELRMKNEEFATAPQNSSRSRENALKDSASAEANSSFFTLHSSFYISDCTLDSDLQMYFPDSYVPTDSERMLLYRELDNIETDEALQAYRQRLQDRFGPVPREGEELMQVVVLRRLGKQLGCEQVMLKQGRMFMYFVQSANSPFYQSDVFGRILDFVGRNARRCQLREQKGRRSMYVTDVPSVEAAVSIMKEMKGV
mgnify:CR=1 FL=1